jgi:Fe-S-cluster containining protein
MNADIRNAFFHERMKALLARMEAAYDEAARAQGFSCEGCAENCCTQRFHHRTLAEYAHLREGMRRLAAEDPARARAIAQRAFIVVDSYAGEAQAGVVLPLMCPVNVEGRCTLYEYRPMICRLHGLPHTFTLPSGRVTEGGGCHRFDAEHPTTRRIDRTDFYTELALLEHEVRFTLAHEGRYQKTTAEMVVDMAPDLGLAGAP